MKRLITYIAVTTLVSAGISWYAYKQLHRYNLRTSSIHGVLTYIMENHNHHDIVFVGSSRVWIHVNPYIIDSLTGLNSYCAALDGCQIVYFKMIIKKYLQAHPKPKVILINVDFGCFNENFQVYNYPDYFPYLKDDVVYECLAPYEEAFRNHKTQSLSIWQRLMALDDKEKVNAFARPFLYNCTDLYKGYKPMHKNWDEKTEKSLTTKIDNPYSDVGFNLLKDCIAICNDAGVSVMFLYAPVFDGYKQMVDNHADVYASVERIAIEHHVPLLNFSTVPGLTDNRDNFFNVTHLNAQGSTIYSHLLGDTLRQLLR